jgi:hypothetical protein
LCEHRRGLIPFDLLCDAWLGLLYAYLARERVRRDGIFCQPPFALVGTFALIIVVPAALYVHLVHPAWSWLYLIDPKRIPGLAIVSVVFLHIGALGAAYYATGRYLRSGRERDRRIQVGLLVGAASIAVVFVLLRRRLLYYGTFGDFHSGRSLPVSEVKLGLVLVAMLVGILVAAGFVSWELWRDGRRVPTR